MCGRVLLLSYEELLAVIEQLSKPRAVQPTRQLELQLDNDSLGQRTQARPGALLEAVLQKQDATFHVQQLRWGFSVPWNEKLVYNTRIESALKAGGMWSSAIKTGRCILPVAAFFEPHGTETERSAASGRSIKRPYVFTSPNAAPLLLACISENEQLSVVTTQPNSSVAAIHKRMPLVLDASEASSWLHGDYTRLADRSTITLDARPEHPQTTGISQQSLF